MISKGKDDLFDVTIWTFRRDLIKYHTRGY